jgi:hypothetical protein
MELRARIPLGCWREVTGRREHNRRYMQTHLATLVAQAHARGKPLTVPVLDAGPDDNGANVLKRADQALYKAKRDGRNRWRPRRRRAKFCPAVIAIEAKQSPSTCACVSGGDCFAGLRPPRKDVARLYRARNCRRIPVFTKNGNLKNLG